jgi:hypothetical protein
MVTGRDDIVTGINHQATAQRLRRMREALMMYRIPGERRCDACERVDSTAPGTSTHPSLFATVRRVCVSNVGLTGTF